MPDELLKITEVAAELKVHPDTIRRYIREGKLSATHAPPHPPLGAGAVLG